MPETMKLINNLNRAIANAEVAYNRPARLGNGIVAKCSSDSTIILEYLHDTGHGLDIYESRPVARYRDGWTLYREAVAEFLARVGVVE
jgi:hypothetical protein